MSAAAPKPKPLWAATRCESPSASRFHDHLDRCEQCREHPMELCRIGLELLTNTLGCSPS